MTQNRVSRGFKDISMTFQANPLNKDLFVLNNETAIARSIRNLVLTSRNERFFNPNLGCFANKLLFENMDPDAGAMLRMQIEETIQEYEPRVKLIETQIEPNFDENVYNVNVIYEIIGIDAPPQKLSFVLQSTR